LVGKGRHKSTGDKDVNLSLIKRQRVTSHRRKKKKVGFVGPNGQLKEPVGKAAYSVAGGGPRNEIWEENPGGFKVGKI